MTNSLAEFDTHFRIPELQVHQTDFWRWSVRPQQPTLGAGILSLRNYQTRLSAMPEGAGADYQRMVRVIEQTLKQCFGYDKINHLMLMMVDSHVHYHVIPRYGGPRIFEGHTWQDGSWPTAPDLGADQAAGRPEILLQLSDHLRENRVLDGA
ncbi:HIT family protein [Aestuariispira insulae]|uniref:Diadenosine tetraphosphate (Ap4A) HIT family hydrolase n=1 Tax=Aestuariispira insulae TaxID=1461337 RepID=A0A3D9HF67_9PROT|nr:HIT family protein [Aestuariispira insulae]RED48124.1 diadenosine tetraphosphate (Ap4A) HIT family hydrolase [Aestuariispira insulae]